MARFGTRYATTSSASALASRLATSGIKRSRFRFASRHRPRRPSLARADAATRQGTLRSKGVAAYTKIKVGGVEIGSVGRSLQTAERESALSEPLRLPPPPRPWAARVRASVLSGAPLVAQARESVQSGVRRIRLAVGTPARAVGRRVQVRFRRPLARRETAPSTGPT